MALHALTSWRTSVSAELDNSEGPRITLRAEMGGTVATSAGETAERIRTSGAIPSPGDPFPDNTSLRCKSVEINPKGPVLFEWTARYEWRTIEVTEEGETGGWPVGWSFARSTRKSQHPIDRDINGAPIMTVTRESPNPALQDEITETQWIATTSGRPWNEDLLELFEDSVNSDVFFGRPPGKVKIEGINATVSFTSGEDPQMDVQVTMLVGKPPPAAKLYELKENSLHEWQTITRPAAYYTWFKRWRAEGFKYIPAGASSPIDANDGDEVQIPRLHDPANGLLITTASEARWYSHQMKPFLPFDLLFRNV